MKPEITALRFAAKVGARATRRHLVLACVASGAHSRPRITAMTQDPARTGAAIRDALAANEITDDLQLTSLGREALNQIR